MRNRSWQQQAAQKETATEKQQQRQRQQATRRRRRIKDGLYAFYDKRDVVDDESERVVRLARVVARLGDVAQAQHVHVAREAATVGVRSARCIGGLEQMSEVEGACALRQWVRESE